MTKFQLWVVYFFWNKTSTIALFYFKNSKRTDRFICRGTSRKPIQTHQCRHVTRPHCAHHHSQPGYSHENTNVRGDRVEVAAKRLHRHTSSRRRFRHHPQLPKQSLTNGVGPHVRLCQQLATRAKDRHLRIRRRASKGKYTGLAPTENKPIGHVGKTDYRALVAGAAADVGAAAAALFSYQ